MSHYGELPDETRAAIEDQFAYATTPVPTEAEAARAVEAITSPLLRHQRQVSEPLRDALQRIRLHGTPWWCDEWGTPASIANGALDEADEVTVRGSVE